MKIAHLPWKTTITDEQMHLLDKGENWEAIGGSLGAK